MSYVKAKASVTKMGEYPIPLRALQAVDGMLSFGGMVSISYGYNKIFFRHGGTLVSCVLNQVSLPVAQVKKMLSVDHPGKSLVVKESVIRAINSFRGIIEQNEKIARAVSVFFNPETKEIIISPNKVLDGESEEVLPTQQMIGDRCDFAINLFYWTNTLRAIDGIEAWIHYDPNNLNHWIHITDVAGNQRYVVAPFVKG
jgi:hypothetical protein